MRERGETGTEFSMIQREKNYKEQMKKQDPMNDSDPNTHARERETARNPRGSTQISGATDYSSGKRKSILGENRRRRRDVEEIRWIVSRDQSPLNRLGRRRKGAMCSPLLTQRQDRRRSWYRRATCGQDR